VAQYATLGKQWIRYNTKQNIAIRYDTEMPYNMCLTS